MKTKKNSEHSKEGSSNKTFDSYHRQSQKVSVKVSRKLAMVIVDEVIGLDSTIKANVIQKYLAHMLVKGMVPKFFFYLNNGQRRHEVLTNVQTSLVTHLISSCPTKIVVVTDIVYTLASFDNLCSISMATIKVLRANKQNIKRGLDICVLLDTMNEAFWINHQQAHQNFGCGLVDIGDNNLPKLQGRCEKTNNSQKCMKNMQNISYKCHR